MEKTYTYYRQNSVDERRNVLPMRLTEKEARTYLAAANKQPDVLLKRIQKGMRVRTRFGIYWAEIKN